MVEKEEGLFEAALDGLRFGKALTEIHCVLKGHTRA